MQTTITRPNDPIARICIFALLFLAFWANIATMQPKDVGAESIIILDSTPTPALPSPAIAVMDVAPAPPEAAPAAAPEEESPPPAQDVAAPEMAAQIDAQTVAPVQATEESPAIDVALNDPNLNGGNVAPDGCPFPIINGVCANGVLAKSIPDPAFGEKSIAEGTNDPTHAEVKHRDH